MALSHSQSGEDRKRVWQVQQGVCMRLRGVLSAQKKNQEQWLTLSDEGQEYQGLIQLSLLL